MILIIDNYDSFTYNLVQRLGEIDPTLDIQVHRNDQITVDEIFERKPDRVIISPGPCTPTEAGISVECCQRLKGQLPLWACASAISRWARLRRRRSCAPRISCTARPT